MDGEIYRIDVSDDLVAWSLAGCVTATGPTTTWEDSVPVNLLSTRFYRIAQVQTCP